MSNENNSKKNYITINSSNIDDKEEMSNLTSEEILDRIEKINKLQKPIQDIALKYTNTILPIVTSQSYINKMTSITDTLNSIAPKIISIMDTYTKNIQVLMDSINISNIVTEYIERYENIINEVFKNIKPISRLTGMDTSILDKYYWVIPFEYDYEKVCNLSKYKTRLKFEDYIIKYFNDNRTKRLFNKLKKQFKEKDKKILLNQIKNSYFNGDYAICIASLMTLLDGATLILIQPNSYNQHNSHKVIGDMLEVIDDKPYELYLKTYILNNFIKTLYSSDYDLKASRSKRLLLRQVNSHGVKYLNNKVNTLRLLNAIYFCNEVIEETNMQEKFINIRGNKKFDLVSTNNVN